jgi:5-methylcytosine-specific restriction endonuclease McrA
LNQRLRRTVKYKKWRSEVFQRDNWTCQTCNTRGNYLEAHHIKSFAKYPKFRYILENGVTLCRECHRLTDNYKGKKT